MRHGGWDVCCNFLNTGKSANGPDLAPSPCLPLVALGHSNLAQACFKPGQTQIKPEGSSLLTSAPGCCIHTCRCCSSMQSNLFHTQFKLASSSSPCLCPWLLHTYMQVLLGHQSNLFHTRFKHGGPSLPYLCPGCCEHAGVACACSQTWFKPDSNWRTSFPLHLEGLPWLLHTCRCCLNTQSNLARTQTGGPAIPVLLPLVAVYMQVLLEYAGKLVSNPVQTGGPPPLICAPDKFTHAGVAGVCGQQSIQTRDHGLRGCECGQGGIEVVWGRG